MAKKLVIDKMKKDRVTAEQYCDREPIKMLQFMIDIMYRRLRHDPDFGLLYLDGMRQAQKDLDHIVNLAAGNPPSTTKKSSLLRQLASQTEFNSVSRELIAKAERMEAQAEGLRYKFSKMRLEEGEKK